MRRWEHVSRLTPYTSAASLKLLAATLSKNACKISMKAWLCAIFLMCVPSLQKGSVVGLVRICFDLFLSNLFNVNGIGVYIQFLISLRSAILIQLLSLRYLSKNVHNFHYRLFPFFCSDALVSGRGTKFRT